jgi:hypothetical protein
VSNITSNSRLQQPEHQDLLLLAELLKLCLLLLVHETHRVNLLLLLLHQAIQEDDVAAVMHEVVHEVLGSELTLAEAEKMVEEVDHQHQGKISLQEVRMQLATAAGAGAAAAV